MATPPTPVNLLPVVDIPLLQPPIDDDVEHADGGIGLRHVEHPLVVHIDRPDNTPDGTVFELFWGNTEQPVAVNFIREGDEQLSRIPFMVPLDEILEDWADPVFAKVIRVEGEGENSETRRLRLRVNLQRPGGRDPDSDMPGHQNLVLELPADVVRDGISEARAHLGVEVVCRYWENMAPYDLIILAWGSEIITYRVQPDQVRRDIPLFIDRATILAAGNGEIIPVGFQVIGPTGNYPDEWARWSATQFIDVYTDTIRPDAPRVVSPATERDIDLADLGNQNVSVEIYINQTDARLYRLATLFWAGKDSEGGPVPHVQSQDLSGYGPYEFEVHNSVITAIAQGSAVVYFLLQGEGVPDKRSNNRHLRVVGELAQLPAPEIYEALEGDLDPNLPWATVLFAPQDIWPGDALLEVVFEAGGPNGTIEHRLGRRVNEVPLTPEGEMYFRVYTVDLKRFEGYSAEVYYVFSRNTVDRQNSLRLPVQVGAVTRDMPKPIIENTFGGYLDASNVKDYVKVFAPFTDTLRYDWIGMRWLGERARAQVKVQVAVNGDTTEHDIGRHFVINNLNSQVTVYYTLEREGQRRRYSSATIIDVVTGFKKDLTDFNDRYLNGWRGVWGGALEFLQSGQGYYLRYTGPENGSSAIVKTYPPLTLMPDRSYEVSFDYLGGEQMFIDIPAANFRFDFPRAASWTKVSKVFTVSTASTGAITVAIGTQKYNVQFSIDNISILAV